MKINKKVFVGIAILLLIFIFVTNFKEELGRPRIILIDAGHGGNMNKFYYYSGEEFNGRVDELDKVESNLSGNKEYFIEKTNLADVANKSYWLHSGDTGANFKFNDISYYEKDINLDIALKLAEKLNKSFNVKMTREDDRYIFLERRRDMAYWENADLFVSIHENSFSGNCDNLNNAEVYYNNAGLRKIAEEILDGLSSGLNFSQGQIKRNKTFAVLNSEKDAMLIEVNYMCNERNAKFLSDEGNQNRIAEIIAEKLEGFK